MFAWSLICHTRESPALASISAHLRVSVSLQVADDCVAAETRGFEVRLHIRKAFLVEGNLEKELGRVELLPVRLMHTKNRLKNKTTVTLSCEKQPYVEQRDILKS